MIQCSYSCNAYLHSYSCNAILHTLHMHTLHMHTLHMHTLHTAHTTHAHTTCTHYTCTRTVDLPSSPLQTEAPQLQHISKSRPKPARLQKGKGKGGTRKQHKPSYLSKAKDEVDIGMPTTTLSLFLSLPLSLFLSLPLSLFLSLPLSL